MKKIWIYQADRILSPDESAQIMERVRPFISSWTAHGSALEGKGYIKHNLFLILEVDEEQAGVTGCSIDKSVHFIKSLEQEFNVNFFDRLKIAYRDEAHAIQLVDRSVFEKLIKSGIVHSQTMVFNNILMHASELESNWEIPFQDSWHSKVF
ncbi:ABC transporter ATPase [Sphingobacterium olei]|uniref:ABC transporter ATPase n=1 Tax=Sphingobacterium olei TaxID=2571155 RepID=A0A4U0P252_9SPHI|nr:ABC transporter ATPase [Sphingobacterium olei]TJZ61170.1 ABC transporter ATPase [Sphingobacterium olei]